MRVLFLAQLALLVVDACVDVTEDSVGDDKECYDNVVWAKETGFGQKPEWYDDYGYTDTSSDADFQCILHENVGEGDGHGWNCKLPCSSTLSECDVASIADTAAPSAASSTVVPDTAASTAAPPPELTTDPTDTIASGPNGSSGSSGSNGSLEWSGWLLLLLAMLLCAAAAWLGQTAL